MAVSSLEYLIVSELRANGLLPKRPRVLELGESNWYDDVSIEQLTYDIQRFVSDPAQRDKLIESLQKIVRNQHLTTGYEIARIWIEAFFQPSDYSTIDPGTPTSTYRYDLNEPVPIDKQFDVTFNFGTAEHVFNVYQFFKTAHDCTVEGGLMIHTAPFTGWPDHGFYNFQPTFFYDLAQANDYQVLSMICGQVGRFEVVQIHNRDHFPALIREGKIPPSGNLNVVLRKASYPVQFKVPVQGYYAGTLSNEGVRAWHELR